MAETNEKMQKGPFKKTRAGVELTKEQVREIEEGRKKLRRDMRAMGINSKKEFEMTASSMGLYFDKDKRGAMFWLLFRGKIGGILLALAGVLIGVLFGFSALTDIQGHFTISMSEELFREGFTISETVGFENPTSHLFATLAESVPCISITEIPENVDSIDGSHNGDYFAYTFYVRNDGASEQQLKWQLNINSESQNLSSAAWVLLFLDGEMTIYAQPNESGESECLPPVNDNTRGYTKAPLYSFNASPEEQYEAITTKGTLTYWRVKPKKFASSAVVESGIITSFKPNDVHKFTVVIWLEGDDPQCTNDLIGGHLGMDFYMEMPTK